MPFGKHSYWESPKDEQHRKAKERLERDIIAYLEQRKRMEAGTKRVWHS